MANVPSNNNRRTISLADIGEADAPSVGGKAANLGRLMSLGFEVPPGFVLTVDAFAEFFQRILARFENASVNDQAALSKEICDAIKASDLPPDLISTIDENLQALGADKVALRSSAVAEDTTDASFAGVYETVLDVSGLDAALEALRHCLCSFFSERALAYRSRSGADPLRPDAAVIVQKMVAAEFSGVMFTTNPVNAHPGEIVIDAAPGLGEAVVSGRVQPDHIVLRKSTGEVKRWKKPTSDDATSIPPDLIGQLWSTGMKIEKSFGAPRDVEWAYAAGKLYTLQARPITTLPPQDEAVFTRKMGDQYWTDVISPLTQTTGVEWIVEGAFRPLMLALGFESAANLDYFRFHKSHLYMNTGMARETISMFPLEARKQYVEAMGSPHDDDFFMVAPYKFWSALWALIRSHWKDERSGLQKNLAALAAWSVAVREKTAAIHSTVSAKPGIAELMKLFGEINRVGVEHFEIIRWGHASYNTSFTDMFRDLCSRWADDEGSLFLTITGHLEENLTLATDQALWETAGRLSRIPAAAEILLNNLPARSAEILLETDQCPEGRALLAGFLADYGHRTTARDFTAKCWIDTPDQVTAVLRGLIDGGLPPSPNERAAEAKIRSEKALEIAIERVRGKSFAFIKRPFFEWVADKCRVFIAYRENQRFTLDRIILSIRRLALALGAELQSIGLLASPPDVFFLTRAELEKVAADRAIDSALRAAIEDRKAELDRNRGVLPPAYIKGDFEFDDQTVETAEPVDGEYVGLGASPGIVKAKARVLKELDMAHTLKSGEILVTESTDPAWSAVFMKAAGLVLETGGLLSHGAILAREFGIPAVTHVRNATALITTGDTIIVDGARGRVAVVEKSDQNPS